MRPELVEDWVSRFLDARDVDPALEPESFATALGADAGEVVAAIRRTLDVERMITGAAEPALERVGAYRVVRELGRGGMGVVYEVERDGERFALKLLHPGSASSPRAVERFSREARALARLDHPGIVAVREVGSERGLPFLVMELVGGIPLAELAPTLDTRRSVEIVRDLSHAVHAAHEAGVLHRDVKPQNVIVRADGTAVLVDFGLVAVEDEPSLTSTGALLGTPRYMAPEQALGAPADRRTDVFGLGLVLYELLCGHPARGESARAVLLESVARLDVAWPSGVRRRIDRSLERVVFAALARQPRRRTATALELADDLQRWLDGRPTLARPPARLVRAWDRARERPLRSAAAGGAIVLLGVLALAAFFREPSVAELRREVDARVEVARELLRRGELDRGLEATLAVAPWLSRAGAEASGELPAVLGAATDPIALAAALERFAAAHPSDALPQYLLAWTRDSSHDLRGAERGYRRAIELDPGMIRARLNLAHLYAGAQLGACGACDSAYAAESEMLAPERALESLLEAVDRDRGASPHAIGRAVQTALDLARRAPQVRAPAALCAEIERVLSSTELDATSRSRLETARERLAAASGE